MKINNLLVKPLSKLPECLIYRTQKNVGQNRIYQIETGSHEAIELFAKFEVITYSISYTLNDGTNGLNFISKSFK